MILPLMSDGTHSKGKRRPPYLSYSKLTQEESTRTRQNWPNRAGIILFTPWRIAQLCNQVHKRDKILNPERAPPGRQHHERVNVSSVGPAPWERALHVTIKERHAILAPRLANSHERELATQPRMERVRHTDSSLRNNPIRRSRQRRRTR